MLPGGKAAIERRLEAFVGIFGAPRDPHDQDDQLAVADLIDSPVLADADAIEIPGTLQLKAPGRPRIVGERLDGAGDSAARRWRERSKLAYGPGLVLKRVHVTDEIGET
jgi:hypothetical protein